MCHVYKQSPSLGLAIVFLLWGLNAPLLLADEPYSFGQAAEEAGYDFNAIDIHLQDKGITSLAGIQFYAQAESIDLQGNKISEIETGAFDGLDYLQYLSLGNNQITTLAPGCFTRLYSLEQLNLMGNQLAILAPELFDELENLQELYLSNNQLTTLDPDMFKGMEILEELGLSGNQFTTLDENFFDALCNLEWLDLKDGQLTTLDPGVFEGLECLLSLDLSNNQLTTLNGELFAGLESLNGIILCSNQIRGEINLAGISLENIVYFKAHEGNAITSVNLSDAILSHEALKVIAEDLAEGGISRLDLSGADLSGGTNFSDLPVWEDLETLDLTNADLGMNLAINGWIDRLPGLNNLHLSQDQWDALPADVQASLTTWAEHPHHHLHLSPANQ